MDDRSTFLLRQGRREGDTFLYLANRVADEASEMALRLLSERNTVTPRHEALVRAMSATTVDSVLGRLPGRYAIVAPVGSGKSTVIACVARAVELYAPDDVGLLILQERIETGADTIEQLMVKRLGMDRGAIAHVFRKDTEGNEGVNPEDALDTRFVVATHARAMMGSIVPLLTFRDRPRAALVDEVLYAGHGSGMTLKNAMGLLGWIEGAFDDDEKLHDMAEWAAVVRDELRRERDRLREAMPDGASSVDAYVKLTAPTEKRAGYWTASLNGKAGASRRRRIAKVETIGASAEVNTADAVKMIESLATSPLTRLIVKPTAEQGGGILQHRRTLPPQMKTALVYDAGAEIDPLLSYDDDLQLAHEALAERHFKHARNPKAIKDWRTVRLHHLKMPGGKDRIFKAFRDEARPWPARVAAKFIKESFGHVDGPVLVVNHKSVVKKGRPNEGLAMEHLRRELEALGFDWNLIQATTWGRTDASNAFQDCIGGVLLGVTRLQQMDLQALALAQTSESNLRPLPTPKETTAIDMAQTASRIYQAVGRCRSRQSLQNGVARPSKWLVITWEVEPLEIVAERLMPGCELLPYGTPEYCNEALKRTRQARRERVDRQRHVAPRQRPETAVDRAAGRLFEHLAGASEFASQTRIGRGDLTIQKAALQRMAGVENRTFRRALNAIESDLEELGLEIEHRQVVVPDWAAAFEFEGAPEPDKG